jgi:hypothetical protein
LRHYLRHRPRRITPGSRKRRCSLAHERRVNLVSRRLTEAVSLIRQNGHLSRYQILPPHLAPTPISRGFAPPFIAPEPVSVGKARGLLAGLMRNGFARLVTLRCGAKVTYSRKRCTLQTLIIEHASYSAGLRPPGATARAQELLDLRRIPAEDLHKVNLATIREGVNHCRWPREVVERFLAVEA